MYVYKVIYKFRIKYFENKKLHSINDPALSKISSNNQTYLRISKLKSSSLVLYEFDSLKNKSE